RREGKSSHLRAYLAAKPRRKELPKTSAEIETHRLLQIKFHERQERIDDVGSVFQDSNLAISRNAIIVFVAVGGCDSSDTGACDTGHSDDKSYRTRRVIFKSHEFKIKRTSLADLRD
ncbi:hypothetical protein V1478_006454, partial [Vespula squamosa]